MSIKTLESLRQHLQWALEVEHATIPPYLSALYSIEVDKNREVAEIIESVFMEEMLHMCLAANLLNAIGGNPHCDKDGFIATYPSYLPHSNKAFKVGLEKLSPEVIQTFMKIEMPHDPDDAPQDDGFATIGQFYDAIEDGLKTLCAELGEENVFTGNPQRQITPEIYYGGSGEIIAVYDLKTALAALEEIKEQGEGMTHETIWDGDRNMFHPEREEVAHYFRFNEIYTGRQYQKGDTPESGPTGDGLEVEWNAVYNMRPNPRSADYPEGSPIRKKMDLFNRAYSSILHLLELCFNGQPRMLSVATGAMYELKQLAVELMQMPSGDGITTVGPSFEYIPPEKRHIARRIIKKVVVMENGPYLIYGDIPLVRKAQIISEYGEPLSWRKNETIETEETYALCRCGHSSTKPFCDGTHVRIRFDGTETADTSNTAERQHVYQGNGIIVKRDTSLCNESGFCGDRFGNIIKMVKDTEDTAVRGRIMAMVERCPSGSYTYQTDAETPDVEPSLPQEIAVCDEVEYAGGLWVSGNIEVDRSDGEHMEIRNRVVLCRCGASSNKPLCDGTHRQINFQEE